MTDETLDYTPENLRDFSRQINLLRTEFLFNTSDAGADPESEQFYLLALNALDAAHHYFSLASYKQSQALVKLQAKLGA
jgi:hypothetical protein